MSNEKFGGYSGSPYNGETFGYSSGALTGGKGAASIVPPSGGGAAGGYRVKTVTVNKLAIHERPNTMTTIKENPIFLYDYRYLYPRDLADRKILGHPISVEPMCLECYNVRREENVNGISQKCGWEFQLVDDPKGVWYRTSYDWALVLKTDENLAQYQQWCKAVVRRDEMARMAETEYKRIIGPEVLSKIDGGI